MNEQPRIFTRDFLILSAYGMVALGLSLMLVTGLPLYLEEKGWDPGQMGWILGSYFLTSLLVRPLVGREADRRGRKAVLIAGGAFMLLPCPFYLLSTSELMVLPLRVTQGVGWAMATTATAALASEIVPQNRIGTGLGIFGILNSLGFTWGPALGAHLLRVGGGPAFLGAASVLAAIVLLCGILITAPQRRGMVAVSWRDAGQLARVITRPLAVTVGVSFGYGAVQTFLPLYAKASGVVNPGIFFTVFSLLSFVSRPTMGRLADVWGRKQTGTTLMIVIAGAFGVLAYSASLPFLVGSGVLYGIGHGAIYTVLMALLADMTRKEDRGLTYGVFGTCIDLGITAGNFVVGSMVSTIGYPGSFVLSAALVLLSLPLLLVQTPAAVSVTQSRSEGEPA